MKTESSSSVTDSTILLSLELTQPSVYEEHYSTICVLLERSVVLFSIISLFWSEPTEVLLLWSRFDPLWYVTLYTEDVVLKNTTRWVGLGPDEAMDKQGGDTHIGNLVTEKCACSQRLKYSTVKWSSTLL